MKYVNRIVGKDGVERHYLRKAGMPSIKLTSPWGSEALAAEVAALLAKAPEKPSPSTLRAALRAYELDSAEFANLGTGTKYEYRLILKELGDDLGDLPISRFDPAYILDLRNAWAKRGHRAAANRLLLLRHALLPSIIAGKIIGGDPFALIPAVPKPAGAGEPHLIWPETVVLAVVAQALKEGKVGLARGVAIGRYAGARRGDIVKMTKAARKGGRISWLSGKRRVLVDMREDPALTAMITGTAHHPRSLVLAYSLTGEAYTEDGFGQELAKIVAKLHKAGVIDATSYNAHGLRHTFGVDAALAGCTDAEGAARMGHSSPNSFATYRRQAERIRLSDNAADKIAALRERTPNGGLQNDLQKICKTAPKKQAKARGKNAERSKG